MTRRLALCALLQGPGELACAWTDGPQIDDTPAAAVASPNRVIVQVTEGGVVASFDGEVFAPWSVVEASFASRSSEDFDETIRWDPDSIPARELMDCLAKLHGAFGPSLAIEYPHTEDRHLYSMIHISESFAPRWSDDEFGCARVEAVFDGRRLMIRSRYTAARMPHAPGLRLNNAAEAVFAMQTSSSGSSSLSESPSNDAVCDYPDLVKSGAPCEVALEETLDGILRIGIACSKGAVYVPTGTDGSLLKLIFEALIELGVEDVVVRLLDEQSLQDMVDERLNAR